MSLGDDLLQVQDFSFAMISFNMIKGVFDVHISEKFELKLLFLFVFIHYKNPVKPTKMNCFVDGLFFHFFPLQVQ
jgi:hypothetical protein